MISQTPHVWTLEGHLPVLAERQASGIRTGFLVSVAFFDYVYSSWVVTYGLL
jgi:hypothetical protein